MDDQEFCEADCVEEAQYFAAGEYEFDDGSVLHCPAGWYSFDGEEWLLEQDDGAYELVEDDE